MIKEDTIAAIATAPGEGGIGIVRISGDKALDILKKIFVPASSKIENRHLSYGHVVDPESGRTIDVNITRLRKKIGEYGKCIVTRLGYGYCFEAE